MAFPHPKSRKDEYRKEDKPNRGGVVWNFFKRTINIAEDRNAKDDVNPAKNRTFGVLVHDVVLLIAVGRQARDHGGKLLEHLRPAELGPLERLLAPRLGDVEAGMLEEDARAVAVRLEPEAHPRIATGPPADHENASRRGRFALQHLAVHDQSVETHLRVRRHAEREVMADARLEVVREHPLGQRGAVGERPPDLLPRLRNQNLS